MKTAGRRIRLRSAILGMAIPLLLSGCGHPDVPVQLPPPQVNSDVETLTPGGIYKMQGLLTSLGYDAGPADGVLGPQTIAAVRAFQKDQRLDEDGRPTPSLLARLEAVRAKLPVSTLPRYEAGESFIYSDGTSEKIQETGNGLRLMLDSGEKRWRPENFLILAGPGEKTDAPADFMQPLRPGSKGRYQLYRRAADGRHESPSTVDCSAGRVRLHVVPAGKFRAIDVRCVETEGGAPVLEREWLYAPLLRQVVRDVVRRNGKEAAIRELVAVRPATDTWPMAARTGLDWAIVNSLREAETRNAPVSWASTGVGERFLIRVDPVPLAAPGQLAGVEKAELCLRYRLVRTDPKGSGQIYPGVACRSGNDEWRIPALQRFVFASPPKGLE